MLQVTARGAGMCVFASGLLLLSLLHLGSGTGTAFHGNPHVQVNIPTGGEVWSGGSTHNVTWSMFSNELELRVDLSYVSNGNETPILTDDVRFLGTHTYGWTLPSQDLEPVSIRVCVEDSGGHRSCDDSATFAIDARPPVVVARQPADGATDVSWTAPVIATFDEPARPANAPDLIGVRDGAGAWVRGVAAWLRPERLGFFPLSPYAPATTYTARLNTTIRDASDPGNPLASAVEWNFTTRANALPTVALEPSLPGTISGGSVWTISWMASDAEDPPGSLAVYLEFSDGGPFSPVAGPLPASGAYDWTAPSTDVATAALRARVVDTKGGGATAIASFTVDATPPAVVAVSPSTGALVPADAVVLIAFSEPMDGRTLDAVGLRESVSRRWIAVSRAWDDSVTVRLTPSEWLIEGLAYEVVINATAIDRSVPGNPLAATAWSFFVESTPPGVLILEPTPPVRWTGGRAQTIRLWTTDAWDPVLRVAVDLSFDGLSFVSLLATTTTPGEAVLSIPIPRIDATDATLRACVVDASGGSACAAVPVSLDGTPPRVLSISPDPGLRRVHPDAPIVVVFSESMNRMAVEAALSLHPATSATFRWSRTYVDDDTLTVEHLRLEELRTYTVILDCGSLDTSAPGFPLSDPCPLAWTFKTAASPAVRLVSPLGGDVLTGGVGHELRWVAVDEEPTVEARVELSVGGGSFFVVLADFEPYSTGNVRITRPFPAVDATGAVVRVLVRNSLGLSAVAHSAPFAIDGRPPRVVTAAPAPGAVDVGPLEDIVLTFSEPVDPASFRKGLMITPSLRDPIVTWSLTTETVRISHAAFRLGTTITVTLSGVRDNSRPGHILAASWSFSVMPDRELPRPALLVEAETTEGRVVVLDATPSQDNDEIVAYRWTVQAEDGTTIAQFFGARVEYRATHAGLLNVTVEVVDASGNAAIASTFLRVRRVEAPAQILLPSDPAIGWLALFASAGSTMVSLTDRGREFLTRVFVLPLYVKLKGGAVLDQETRGMIRGYILVHPGDRYTDIKRNLGLANGEVAYHLGVLEREGIVRSVTRGAKKLYYPADAPVPEDGGDLHEIQRRLLQSVEEVPGMSVRDLAGILGVSSQLALYHVRKLGEAGLVMFERRGMRLRVYPTKAEERARHRARLERL